MIIWELNTKLEDEALEAEECAQGLQATIDELSKVNQAPTSAGSFPSLSSHPGGRLKHQSRIVSPPPHAPVAAAGGSVSQVEELAEALRIQSLDNPDGGNTFTIQGGAG